MKKIIKILIANRGEIAIRIARTAKKMGILTVGIYASDDYESLHLHCVDESVSLESNLLSETYLNADKIIDIAKKTGCDAVHPGYGFLSEDADFAEVCKKSGLIFIGPSPEVIRLMGNKLTAHNFVKSSGIPVLKNALAIPDVISNMNGEFQYPLLVKATAGGGGKGIRLVNAKNELNEAVEATSREALSYFGDSSVYIEQYISNPRHIEVQILGDHYGNVIHLFERECTIQRRHQKIIEEAPSESISNELRNKLTSAAIKIASSVGYTNAGTIEFLVDGDFNFYFLEMNTRIQVEHPVTEMITDVDVVQEQIRIANGDPISMVQDDIIMKGHSIEVRIYAEDPGSDFLPSPGRINYFSSPHSEDVRIDSGIYTGYTVKQQYDPMIAKFIVHGNDRNHAISLLNRDLDQLVIHGIQHNISFLKAVLNNKEFIQNRISTVFIENNINKLISEKIKSSDDVNSVFIASALAVMYSSKKDKQISVWEKIGFWRQFYRIPLMFKDKTSYIEFFGELKSEMNFKVVSKDYNITDIKIDSNQLSYRLLSENYFFYFSVDSNKIWFTNKTETFQVIRKDVLDSEAEYKERINENLKDKNIISPMHGKVLKIFVKPDSVVKKGETVLIIESMKMENKLVSPIEGKILKIHVTEGQQISTNHLLIEIGRQ